MASISVRRETALLLTAPASGGKVLLASPATPIDSCVWACRQQIISPALRRRQGGHESAS